MHELKVGQKVWYLPPNIKSNPINQINNKALIETKIIKIGKKYFQIDYDSRLKFSIETLHLESQYSYLSRIILSDVEYYQEKQFNIDWNNLKSKFHSIIKCPYTHDQVKRVLEILTENSDNKVQ